MKFYIKIVLVLIFTSCASKINLSHSEDANTKQEFKEDSLFLFDKSRNRSIPVALYFPN